MSEETASRNRRRPTAAVERSRIAVLKKREDHLWRRVNQAEASGRDLSFDKAEASALHWILTEYKRMKEDES